MTAEANKMRGAASGATKSVCARRRLLPAFTLILLCLSGGCAGWWSKTLPPPEPPLKIVVAQMALEAPITKSTQMQTFEETPSPEIEPVIRTQLIEEVELRVQRLLTEQLAAQPGFQVMPFSETRRLAGNLGVRREPLSDAQLRALADESGADIIITGRIPDYGAVRWQYWVGGWAMTATAHLMTVGFASGWNPAIVGGFMALDLSTDLPFWWGGAYAFGWGLRPVRVQVEAVQTGRCGGPLWDTQTVMVLIPGKTLAVFPPEERRRKEVQLGVNLERAIRDIADAAGRSLRLKPCGPEPESEQAPQ
ncbi:MAG: hypothetical protein GDA68_00480 [Nitrospira sp. CR2.1]|jgi:hypothetical protein|nr:hypothetical protein [Nitrospira sp. CR2.1]MCE7975889.1 hypothetical protein [Nitrospira sp. NTP1]